MPTTLTHVLNRLRRLTARPDADADAALLDRFVFRLAAEDRPASSLSGCSPPRGANT
jgi:hypothetical protein